MLLDTSPKATTVLFLCNDIIINPLYTSIHLYIHLYIYTLIYFIYLHATLRKELSWCFRGCEGEPGGKVVTSFACCNAAFHWNGVSTGSLRVL